MTEPIHVRTPTYDSTKVFYRQVEKSQTTMYLFALC